MTPDQLGDLCLSKAHSLSLDDALYDFFAERDADGECIYTDETRELVLRGLEYLARQINDILER